VHDLATILDELVKAQPQVIGRTAKPGTQAWLVKDGWGILHGQWGYFQAAFARHGRLAKRDLGW